MELLLYLMEKKLVFKSTQLKLGARLSCPPETLAQCERGELIWPISYGVQNLQTACSEPLRAEKYQPQKVMC